MKVEIIILLCCLSVSFAVDVQNSVSKPLRRSLGIGDHGGVGIVGVGIVGGSVKGFGGLGSNDNSLIF